MTHRAEKSRGKSTDPSNTKAKHASDGRKFEQINIKIRINGRSLRYAKAHALTSSNLYTNEELPWKEGF